MNGYKVHSISALINYLTSLLTIYIKDILLTRKDRTMTNNEFIQLCNSHCISPEIAIENKSIRRILTNDNRPLIYQSAVIYATLIEEVLINEF